MHSIVRSFTLGLMAACVIVTPGARAAGAGDQRLPTPDALAAFARLYGVVRYFHPSDAAGEVDWDRFAIHGAARVSDCRDAEELQQELTRLFAPMSRGVEIVRRETGFAARDRRLPDGGAAVAWRYLGPGQASTPGGNAVYRRWRSHRDSALDATDHVALEQWLEDPDLGGAEIRLTARIRTEATAEGAGAGLLLQGYKTPEQPGTRVDLQEHPLRDPRWQVASITATLEPGSTVVRIGLTVVGDARVGVDDVRLERHEADGRWTALPLVDGGFERGDGWGSEGGDPTLTTQRRDNDAPEGRYWQALEPSTGVLAPPFEPTLASQPDVEFDLGAGLKARVPLVLTDAEARIDDAQREGLDALARALPPARAVDSSADAATRAADLIVAWNIYRHFYPYWAEVGGDWDATLPGWFAAETTHESALVHQVHLEHLVAAVRDGHGEVVVAADKAPMRHLPLRVRWIDEQLIVTASQAPKQARVGDRIIAVDGVPAAMLYAERLARRSGSTARIDRRAAETWMRSTTKQDATLQLEHADGRRSTATLPYALPKAINEQDRPAIGELAPGVAYLDLRRASAAEMEQQMATLAAARAVIVDLRGYPTDAGAALLPHLVDRAEHTRWMHVPLYLQPFGGIAGWSHFGWDVAPVPPHIGGRVIFLTDAMAISYAESVMGYIADLHLGTIVGSPTAGTNGNIVDIVTPGGYKITLTGMRVTGHDGVAQLHLVGVPPDVEVVPTIAGIRAGRDEVLERALELLAAGTEPKS